MNEMVKKKESENEAGADTRRSRWHAVGRGALLLFGVLLPLGTLLFELVTGLCSEILFDPIPTWGHVLLVALVPAANFVGWIMVTRHSTACRRWLGALNAAAATVCLYYSLVFLPVLPFAVLGLVAIVYFGLGLFSFLPLSPLLALVSTFRIRRSLRMAMEPPRRVGGAWAGAIVALALLTVVSLPDAATRVGLRMAVSSDLDTSLHGIRLLRVVGREEILRRACYRMPTGPVDLVSWLAFMNKPVSREEARAVYFRVTGDAASTRPPPTSSFARGLRRGGDPNLFEFDMEQGGDAVGGRLRGLKLSDSRMDGSVDARAGLAYLEWTLVFRNESPRQQEARAQLQLPPGAVVSRLTLWIDGEEREAAFGTRSRVRQAYERVVRKRRDPVLVTTCGPDRVLVQCFPVPPRGGEMKTRIGMTIPLVVESPESGVLLLPRVLERNFAVPPGRDHAVWLEGNSQLLSASTALKAEQVEEDVFAVRGGLSHDALNDPLSAVYVERDPAVRRAWAADYVDPEFGVVQEWQEPAVEPVDRVVIVVDGSRHMQRFLPVVADALETNWPARELAVLFAGDRVDRIAEPTAQTPEQRAQVAAALRACECRGGQDNTTALAAAWDLAAEAPNGVVLWVHGPQWYLPSAGEALRQRLERRPGGPVLYELQAGHGPNRLVEKLDGLAPVRHVHRRGGFRQDLGAWTESLGSDAMPLKAFRQRLPIAEARQAGLPESSAHLVRLWARDRVLADVVAGDPERIREAALFGARYQLVTPLTGAVVLETQAQYEDAGLEPVPPGSVPTVPEPETWAMIAIAAVVLGWLFVRRRGWSTA